MHGDEILKMKRSIYNATIPLLFHVLILQCRKHMDIKYTLYLKLGNFLHE